MRFAGLIVAAAVVAAGGAPNAPSGPTSAVARCGHVAEIEAAKQALERGDREAALRHLEAADELLLRCEKEGIPVETAPQASPTQTGAAGAAARRVAISDW
jgi:hypothetical protein